MNLRSIKNTPVNQCMPIQLNLIKCQAHPRLLQNKLMSQSLTMKKYDIVWIMSGFSHLIECGDIAFLLL